jgi:hypothetical protein
MRCTVPVPRPRSLAVLKTPRSLGKLSSHLPFGRGMCVRRLWRKADGCGTASISCIEMMGLRSRASKRLLSVHSIKTAAPEPRGARPVAPVGPAQLLQPARKCRDACSPFRIVHGRRHHQHADPSRPFRPCARAASGQASRHRVRLSCPAARRPMSAAPPIAALSMESGSSVRAITGLMPHSKI